MTKAWWFSAGKTLPHGDGRRVAVGKTHKIKGVVVPCKKGLHASVKPLDALKYAPGLIIWRVDMKGDIIVGHDKLVASERTYLAGGVDATETLRKFARMCALDVIHLWDAPDVVVTYLKTGDEDLRAAARDAAWAAARDAAWAAADAAGDAADAADAARAAADAAGDAADAADAARAAADAAGDAADAAWVAAWAAAWDATRAAHRKKQNKRLSGMLTRLIDRGSS